VGGFPCQPFSLAGVSKKNSLGREHGFRDANQGNLFLRIIEIVELHRPRIVFLENVRNILSHDGKKTWSVIQQEFDNANYELYYSVISTAPWVPQKRERVFMVALDREYFSIPDKRGLESGIDLDAGVNQEFFSFPTPPRSRPTLAKVLEPHVDSKYTLSEHLWGYLQDYAAKHRAKGNGFGYGLFSADDVARTLSARYHKDGAEILISQGEGQRPRRLSPREAARLMGFTGQFARHRGYSHDFPIVVSDTQAYRQFGNSVSPDIVAAVAGSFSKLLRSV
jgi:DNA (cytosine-5)-methyltransferase 1